MEGRNAIFDFIVNLLQNKRKEDFT